MADEAGGTGGGQAAPARNSYTLKTPIPFGSQVISELKFRALKAKDIRDIPLEGQTAGHLITVAGKLCGQPDVVMDELELEDIVGITEVVVRFLPPGLLAGMRS